MLPKLIISYIYNTIDQIIKILTKLQTHWMKHLTTNTHKTNSKEHATMYSQLHNIPN
jgi:hypothetical protein